MTRLSEVTLLLLACLGLSGCQQPPSKWTTGFWFWHGSSADTAWSGEPLDALFVHVGTIHSSGADADLPAAFPPAREYWLVFRYERQRVPPMEAAPAIAREVSRLRAAARKRNLNVAGVQLDIDSPTGALAKYAGFLREVRKGLPQDCQISITALLDWFRSGTAIPAVIAEVDEFVPQFYDVDGGVGIAARIDAARWGPVFNRFRKRFRIGISSFGRARRGVKSFSDLAPLDIATNPAFESQTARSQADELVLSYRAARNGGETVQFILSTPEAIRAAVESARQMRGYLAGVVFFRWPGSNESLAMQPDEVLAAAGLRARDGPARNRIQAIDGRCAAAACADLYFESAAPFSPKPVRYLIRASTAMEYFLPERNMPVRMTGASQLELSLPPYCGRGRLYLGRAVAAAHSEFTVEEEP